MVWKFCMGFLFFQGGANFWSRVFFGFCGKPQGFFVPIRSFPSLEIRITPTPTLGATINFIDTEILFLEENLGGKCNWRKISFGNTTTCVFGRALTSSDLYVMSFPSPPSPPKKTLIAG